MTGPELVATLEEFLAALRAGRQTGFERLHRMIGFLHGWIAAERDGSENLPGNPEEVQSLRAQRQRIFAEAVELAEIYGAYPGDQVSQISKKLAEALRGPDDTLIERNTSNQPRNTAFELTIAGLLRSAGVWATLDTSGHEPDVTVQVPRLISSRNLILQCKRPMTRAGVGELLKKARRQIERRTPANHYGAFALSLTRALLIERPLEPEKILPEFNRAEIEREAYAQVDQVRAENTAELERMRDSRIVIGGLYHLGLPIRLPEYGLSTCYFVVVESFRPGTEASAALRFVAEKLMRPD